ncbi:MAG TPA: hypothetical protein VGI70_18930, partial [Polyangiales bacterium]
MVDRNTEPELAWDDIQGDILIGLQKDAEWFIGFDIAPGKTQQFKQFLRGALSPLITSLRVTAQNEAQVQAHKQRGLPGKLDIVGVNVGFSFKGLNALGVANLDQIADAPFRSGLVADSPNL